MKTRRTTKTLAVTLVAYIVATQVFAWIFAEPLETDEEKLKRLGLLDQFSMAIGAETGRLPVPPPTHTRTKYRFRTWNLV